MPNFMLIWGVRPKGPVVIPCSTVQHDFYIGPRYNRGAYKPDLKDPRAGVAGWTVAQVSTWLQDKGFPQATREAFASADIDGCALLKLVTEDIKTLVPQMGQRLRLESHLDSLRDFLRDVDSYTRGITQGEFGFQNDEVQVQVPLTSTALLSLFTALGTARTLPRVALVVYTGEAIDRWGQVQDELSDKAVKHGLPLFMIDIRSCKVQSVNMCLDDKLTASVYLNGERFLVASAGYRDAKGVGLKAHLHNIGYLRFGAPAEAETPPLPDEFSEDYSLGVAVVVDAVTKKSSSFEFGKFMSWSTAAHRIYPAHFKEIIFELMLCHARKANPIALLPKDVLFVILGLVAKGFDASPFSDIPPCPLPPAKKGDHEVADDVNLWG